jgi:hypothetical protein
MIACWAAQYPLYYDLGYHEQSNYPLGYSGFLEVVGAISFPVLVITWVASLIRRKHRFWTTAMMIGLLILMGLVRIMPPPSRMVVYGLRDRLVHDNSLDEIRRFAQDFDKLPPSNDDHLGTNTGTKQFMREDLARTGLKEQYSFLNRVKTTDFDGPSYVHEEDGVVDVRWGSAYAGHWGFSVSVKGGKLDLSSEPGTPLRLSDDILVVSELD